MDKKLSADWLYHYTRNIESLKNILALGFRYSRLEEVLPYRPNSYQASYAVCFCDLIIGDADSHRVTYGSLAIALTKEWGIKNGISPVRYAHSNSPGNDINYRLFKTLKYDCEKQYPDLVDRNLMLTALARCVRDHNVAGKEISLPFIVERPILEKYCDELVTALSNETDEMASIFRHTIEALHFYIQSLQNELEMRDHFMRVYEEIDKNTWIRRYDEREWRTSFKPSREQFERLRLNEIPRGIKHQLDDEFNIKFDDVDVKSIIVSSQEECMNLEDDLNTSGRSSLIKLIEILPRQ